MSWSLVEGIGLGADATLYVKALRSSVCAVFIVELNYPDNPIVYVNASFEEMTGYHLEDALGQNSSFLQKESDPTVFDEINMAIKTGQKYYGIVKNTHKRGHHFLSELRLSPAHDLKGELTHFIGVLCDMSAECLNEVVQTDEKKPVKSACNEQDLKRVNEQLLREIQKRYQAEQEQYAQIEYLKNLQKVTQAIGVSSDPEHWLGACVEAIRDVFQADRAWLLYPCDPEADFFTVPVEAFVSEYPELHESDEPQPISGEIKKIMQHCLVVEKPTIYHQVENEFSNERLSIQSQMLMALKPRVGKPWVLALHQCSHKKDWSEEQQRLFKDIGDHVKELLNSVSLHKELKERENRLRLLLESTEEGIYGIDADGVCTFANLASAKQLGYKSSSELVGKNIRHLTNFNCPGNDSESSNSCKNCQVQKEGESVFWDGGYFQREDGSNFPVEFRCNPIRYDSSVDRATVTFINITERKKSDAKIWHQANYDQLTGLPERSLLMNRLEQAIQTARRDKHRVAVMFIDLDHFKLINDSLGHSAGDSLLVETAQRLRACVRESDTVARLSGDEFAIILPEVNFVYNVERVAEKILKTLVEPFKFLKDAESFISATIGISLFPDDSQDAETLLKYADMAMYKAKRGGRNKSAFFTEELNQAALKHFQVEQELRQAIERDELEVYYQPQVNLKTGIVVGAEALLRWHHLERGLLYPRDFIPLAEENELIFIIDRWVLRNVIKQRGIWCEKGLPSFKTSVNISARQCLNAHFVNELKAALNESPFPANELDLALDLTESLVLEKVDELVEQLQKIRDIGVSLTMDDFGTGYSSLVELKYFPVEAIKVARDFVKNIACDKRDAGLTNAIISMGHHLGMKVVAEGVETAEQLEILKQAGCETAHGHYFSEALPAKEFEEFLRKALIY